MKVMLIDDDATSLRIISLMVSRCGHDAISYSDPREAIRAFALTRPDVVLSDLNMPEMSGFEVAEEMSLRQRNGAPKVLLMSGGYDDTYIARMNRTSSAEVIGMLRKPFTPADLERALALLGATRTRCPGTFGSFCPFFTPGHRQSSDLPPPTPLCMSNQYSKCLHYDALCGKSVRQWLAAGACGGYAGNYGSAATDLETAPPPA